METIRVFRNKAGFTQGELAEKVGLSLNTILNYETGKRDPRSKDLQRIAEALGCDMSDLLNPPASSESTRTSA